MDDLVINPSGIEWHWTFTGTNTVPDGTGKRVRITGYEAWTMDEDGLIAQSQGHFNKAEYDRQIEHGVDEA